MNKILVAMCLMVCILLSFSLAYADGMVDACPHCGNEVTFEIDGFDFEEENLCPACGKPLFPDDEEEE